MPPELAKAEKLKEAVKTALDEFTKRGEKTKNGKKRKVNLIDPDSVLVQSRLGNHCGYSLQTVADDRNGLIAHADVVNEANDLNQLTDQILGAEAELGRKCEIACADAGYSDIVEIEKLESAEKTVVVPSQAQVADKEAGAFEKSKFTYDSDSDCYLCPEGNRMIFKRFQDKEKQKKEYRIENPEKCRSCRHFGQCTESNQGHALT